MTERNSAAPVGFGPYIRSLREAADMKQKAVAARVGVSQAHLSSMEAKAHLGYLPAPEIVAALAVVYGVPETALLQASGYLTDAEASTAATAPQPAVPTERLSRVIDDLITIEQLIAEGQQEAREINAAMDADDQQQGEQLSMLPERRRRRAAG